MKTIRLFETLMSSSVTIEDKSGDDTYGNPTYKAPVRYKAHISRQRRIVRNATGQQIVSEQAIYLNGSPSTLPTARVTLSTGDVGSTESWSIHPLIVAVERRFDQKGPHHTVLYV